MWIYSPFSLLSLVSFSPLFSIECARSPWLIGRSSVERENNLWFVRIEKDEGDEQPMIKQSVNDDEEKEKKKKETRSTSRLEDNEKNHLQWLTRIFDEGFLSFQTRFQLEKFYEEIFFTITIIFDWSVQVRQDNPIYRFRLADSSRSQVSIIIWSSKKSLFFKVYLMSYALSRKKEKSEHV